MKKTKKSTLIIACVVFLAVMAGIGTGLYFAKTDDAFAFNVDPVRVHEYEEVNRSDKDEESNHILNAAVIGSWTRDIQNDMTYGLRKSYDMKPGTKWNPQANGKYVGEPGVVYLLDGYYDMDSWSAQFDGRQYFFQLYASEDGENYTLLTEVTKENAAEVYDDTYLCTLNDLNIKHIAYVKMIFTGTEDNSNFVNLHEVSFTGTFIEVGPVEIPEWVDPNALAETLIASHKLVGSWVKDLAKDAAYGPDKSYDENMYSKWNPQAQPGFEGEPGIIYTLKKASDIRKIQVVVASAEHYFDVYVSKDGSSYIQIASINSANAARAYQNGDNDTFICNLDGLKLDDITNVKIVFTGRPKGNTFVNLMEVVVSEEGTSGIDTSWMMATVDENEIDIIANKVIGSWVRDLAKDGMYGPTMSYDGDSATKWNPQAQDGYQGEPGIIYTLRNESDIQKITIEVGTSRHYFDVYVSKDGTDYTKLASISNQNADQAYVIAENNNHVCNLDGLNLSGIKYIKLMFTGRKGNNTYINLMEVTVSKIGNKDADASWMIPTVSENSEATIISHEISGSWTRHLADDLHFGPDMSYDRDDSTKWNPQANTGYAGEPGIIYSLYKAADIKKLTITVGSAVHYFDVYASVDGSTYTKVAEISDKNADKAYSNGTTDNTRICTLDGLSLENIKYVKLVFTGRPGNNTYVNLMEVAVSESGATGIVNSWMLPTEEELVALTIQSHATIGAWEDDKSTSSASPDKSYDDDVMTKWNPVAANDDFSGAPGIVYTLNRAGTVKKLVFTLGSEMHWFDVYVSKDGSEYTKIAAITEANADQAYTNGSNNNKICTLDGLNLVDVTNVKVVLTGRKTPNKRFVNFVEAAVSETGTDGLDISWMLPTEGDDDEEQPDTQEAVKATITANTLVGTWKSNGDPTKAYDGSTSTKWNPQSTGFESGEGIVFTLDKSYDLTKMVLTWGSRVHYFKVQVSADNVTYTDAFEVTAANASDYYTDYVSTIENLTQTNVKYVKILITGNAATSFNTYVNLFEVEVYGKEVVDAEEEPSDTREEKKASITANNLVGTWKSNGDPTKAYDGSTSTKWNPQSTGFESGEGIVFTLDKSYDLTKMVLTWGSRVHYFKVQVSADNVTYTDAFEVTAANASDYYTDYVSTIENLTQTNVKYVKILITGNAATSFNTYVNLFEVEVYGKEAESVNPIVAFFRSFLDFIQ